MEHFQRLMARDGFAFWRRAGRCFGIACHRRWKMDSGLKTHHQSDSAGSCYFSQTHAWKLAQKQAPSDLAPKNIHYQEAKIKLPLHFLAEIQTRGGNITQSLTRTSSIVSWCLLDFVGWSLSEYRLLLTFNKWLIRLMLMKICHEGRKWLCLSKIAEEAVSGFESVKQKGKKTRNRKLARLHHVPKGVIQNIKSNQRGDSSGTRT